MPRTYVRRPGDRRPQDKLDFKVYSPWWTDPYWWVQGSSIEKMVMAELVRRGVYFQHTPQSNALGGFVDPSWEADFLLPQYKIWIEVQGSYFHSLPGQIETDAYRFAAIQMAGWKPIALWEFDIRYRLNDRLNEIPELYMVDKALNQRAAKAYGSSKGLPFFEGGVGIDHLAGLRKALSKRRKPKQYTYRHQRKRRPK